MKHLNININHLKTITMKRPSKQERRKIYQKALIGVEQFGDPMCYAVHSRGDNYKHEDRELAFPELYLFKPDKILDFGFWLPSHSDEIRAIIIDFCIEMTR